MYSGDMWEHYELIYKAARKFAYEDVKTGQIADDVKYFDDLVSVGIEKLMYCHEHYQECGAKFTTYLYKYLKLAFLNERRRMKWRLQVTLDEARTLSHDTTVDVIDRVYTREIEQEINRGLEEALDMDKMAWVATTIEGMTQEEVGDLLGVTKARVGQRKRKVDYIIRTRVKGFIQ